MTKHDEKMWFVGEDAKKGLLFSMGSLNDEDEKKK